MDILVTNKLIMVTIYVTISSISQTNPDQESQRINTQVLYTHATSVSIRQHDIDILRLTNKWSMGVNIHVNANLYVITKMDTHIS